MKTKFCLLIALLTTGSTLLAQQMQGHTSNSGTQIAFVNQTSSCITPYGDNCWSSATVKQLSQVITSTGPKVATGQHVLGTDSSGCVWSYGDPFRNGNNAWTQQTSYGCGLSYVQYGMDGNLYALSGCNLVKWTGSWSTVSSCFKYFSVDHTSGTGLVQAIDGNNALWKSTNFGASFSQIAGCGSQGGMSGVAVLSETTIAITCHNGNIFYGLPDGSSYTQLPGTASGSIAGSQAEIFMVGTDGAVNRWILQDNYTAWDHYAGSPGTSWVDYDPEVGAAWSISNGSTLRFAEQGWLAERQFSGYTVCQGGPCPTMPSVYHYAQTHVWWKINGNVVADGNRADTGHINPATHFNISTSALLHDVPECLVQSGLCEAENDYEKYVCSTEGPFNVTPGPSDPVAVQKEIAYTRLIPQGNPYNSAKDPNGTGTLWLYHYGTSYCNNTVNPDYQPASIEASSSRELVLDVTSRCTSFFQEPWICNGSALTRASGEFQQDPGEAFCTSCDPSTGKCDNPQ